MISTQILYIMMGGTGVLFAIFIIAYCAIPIIMVLLVVWVVKLIFGVTIPKPNKENFMLLNKLKQEKTTENKT